jgi:DNA polymerase-4
VIRPGEGAAFVAGLPVSRFHGVGPRGAEKMAALGIATGADLRMMDLASLRQHFGAQADYLYRAARGIDLRAVTADRPRKSVGAERTFDRDLSSGPVLRETLETILDLTWERIARADVTGRTVTLKLKFRDFSAMSRARSISTPVSSREALAEVARGLLDQVLPLPQPVRLMGVILSALDEPGDAAAAPPAGQAELPF